MHLSDIVDVVGITPVPSPAPSQVCRPTKDNDDNNHNNDDGGNEENPNSPTSTAPTTSAIISESDDSPTSLDSELVRSRPDEDSRIRCICSNEEDDGFTIQCDSCLVWQHALCVGVARNDVPEIYLCEKCRPNENKKVKKKDHDEETIDTSPKGRRRINSAATSINQTGLPLLNEITTNIISTKASELVRQYGNQWDDVRLRMPRLAKDIPLGQVNFEQTTVVALFSLKDLQDSFKAVEVRELRLRNYGRRGNSNGLVSRYGVFAGEDIDPGAIIGEYYGHVQPIDILASNSKRVENVGTSYVLFCEKTPELIVDARKFGSNLRYIRRSCRANCQVKMVLTPNSFNGFEESLHWCLFARNTIRENEELFLPFDYADGNSYFRYECCCMYPELCLADEIPMLTTAIAFDEEEREEEENNPAPSKSKIIKKSTSGSASGFVPTFPKNSRSLSGTQLVTTMQSTSMGNSTGRMANRKLSREERKLQQYIEFFERMESAEKNRQKRSMVASGAASPPDIRPKSTTRSSPKKSKKDTKNASSMENDGAESSSKPTLGFVNIEPFSGTTLDNFSASPLQSSDSDGVSSPEQRKKTLPLKKFLAKSMSNNPVPETVSLHSSPIKSPLPIKRDPILDVGPEEEKEEEGHEIVDVVDDSPSPPHTPTSTVPTTDIATMDTIPPTTASVADTPTKRKVSLSDYLLRRKSSPMVPRPAEKVPLVLHDKVKGDPREAKIRDEINTLWAENEMINTTTLENLALTSKVTESAPSNGDDRWNPLLEYSGKRMKELAMFPSTNSQPASRPHIDPYRSPPNNLEIDRHSPSIPYPYSESYQQQPGHHYHEHYYRQQHYNQHHNYHHHEDEPSRKIMQSPQRQHHQHQQQHHNPHGSFQPTQTLNHHEYRHEYDDKVERRFNEGEKNLDDYRRYRQRSPPHDHHQSYHHAPSHHNSHHYRDYHHNDGHQHRPRNSQPHHQHRHHQYSGGRPNAHGSSSGNYNRDRPHPPSHPYEGSTTTTTTTSSRDPRH